MVSAISCNVPFYLMFLWNSCFEYLGLSHTQPQNVEEDAQTSSISLFLCIYSIGEIRVSLVCYEEI